MYNIGKIKEAKYPRSQRHNRQYAVCLLYPPISVMKADSQLSGHHKTELGPALEWAVTEPVPGLSTALGITVDVLGSTPEKDYSVRPVLIVSISSKTAMTDRFLRCLLTFIVAVIEKVPGKGNIRKHSFLWFAPGVSSLRWLRRYNWSG